MTVEQVNSVPDSENPYLFATGGPKKVIDHGQGGLDEKDNFDVDEMI